MSVLLPALKGKTALEMSEEIIKAVDTKNMLKSLPKDLTTLINHRFIIPSQLEQEDLPMSGQRTILQVSYVKKIGGMTVDKTFRGKELTDGSIVGKSVFKKPFPFIVLGGWTEKQKGFYNQQTREW